LNVKTKYGGIEMKANDIKKMYVSAYKRVIDHLETLQNVVFIHNVDWVNDSMPFKDGKNNYIKVRADTLSEHGFDHRYELTLRPNLNNGRLLVYECINVLV
jgi:hypothetical protein